METRFTKEALASCDGKTVPLVIYDEDGKRTVIGEATMKVVDDGIEIAASTGEIAIWNPEVV